MGGGVPEEFEAELLGSAFDLGQERFEFGDGEGEFLADSVGFAAVDEAVASERGYAEVFDVVYGLEEVGGVVFALFYY